MGPVVVAPGAETPVTPKGDALLALPLVWKVGLTQLSRKPSHEKVVAAGEVDRKSLGDLDRDLAKKLGFIRSIPLAQRKNWDLGPATEDGRASDERMGWVTVAAPPVMWTMKSLKPSRVAVVTPINAGK
jgi:hypothetical protein